LYISLILKYCQPFTFSDLFASISRLFNNIRMLQKRLIAIVIILIAGSIGYFYDGIKVSYDAGKTPIPFHVGVNDRSAYKLGLDLAGGTHLVYKADTSAVDPADVAGAMNTLQEVIERRVNLFGVAEPLVQVEQGGFLAGNKDQRLIVELPGVTDVQKAIELIGKTPLLEFLLVKDTTGMTQDDIKKIPLSDIYTKTELSGRYLSKATLEFDQTTGIPKVGLTFNSDGAKIFAKITKANIGRILAISLDGAPISTPVIRQEITGGNAEISGQFTPTEARDLVRNLNYGALPLPIELVSTQTIGPSLGAIALGSGMKAGVIAFIVISLFLIFWYRLPGVMAVIALIIYSILNLALFKFIPVTLTAAGIGGFILSIGMAVDANILIFERMKEELKRGKNLEDAVREGFLRAWNSIRDSNSSSIITAVILFWFASTSVVKGFALVFGLGVLVSMFTAITASRTFLMALRLKDSKLSRFLFSSGVR